MKKIYEKTPNYQKALSNLIQKKYPQLILGILVSYLISSYSYNIFLKNIKINFALPKLSFNLFTKPKKIILKKSTPQIKTYIVQPGDDLWHIAEKFYGSGFNAYDISIANNIDPSSPIIEGQKLIIPSVKPRQPTTGETSSLQTSQVVYTEGKYVVQPGDSLSLISFKVYGDFYSWPRILKANNLQNPDLIEIGMVLNIPR
ncbi:MAG: hypothetical protein KatS3mg092_0800 [Patescibacteria group bacterium]|nr:MAG: hypothetical protein KatS3mg092_0800 [Patescibacteria group bacterium]